MNEKNGAYQKVIDHLQSSGVEYIVHHHPPVCTIDDAHERVPHLTNNLLKTVVFKIKNGAWVLAAVNGVDRIDYKKLSLALQVNRRALRPIPAEQVEYELGFEVGGVGPFPVADNVRVVIDETLAGIGNVFCGAGIRTRTVEIDLDLLVDIARAVVAPISRENGL